MQNKEVRIDLKVSRRESGLLQSDLAQLLSTTQPRISRLEQGKSALTIEEAVKLTIVFGKPPSKLFRLLAVRMRSELAKRMSAMPGELVKAPDAEARQRTLARLSQSLSANHKTDDENEQ